MAKLSNLHIESDEISDYAERLSESLTYIDNLNDIDTSAVTEDTYMTESRNVTREDAARKERILSQDDALSNAHNKKNDSFVVKRIL